MPKRINLYGTIVSSDDAWFYEWFEMDHTTPRMITDQLTQANGDDVELYINSPGGDVWAGSDIYTALREYSGNVIAKVVMAASAASVAMCGAKTVMISPTGFVMVHRASTSVWGNKNNFEQVSQMLSSVDEGMANAYEHKTGKSREELLTLMDSETYLNAQQAIQNGFADEIMFDQTEKVTASAIAPVFSSEVMNKIKSKLIRENLLPGSSPTASIEPQKPASDNKTVIENREELKIMDKNELKEKHPDLFAQVTSEAQAAERERVTALQAYAKAPGAEQFVSDAITNGGTVQDVAVKVMEASMKRAGQEATNRKLDAEESGVDDVEAIEAKTPDAEKEEKKASAVSNMVAMAQKMKPKNGGRK